MYTFRTCCLALLLVLAPAWLAVASAEAADGGAQPDLGVVSKPATPVESPLQRRPPEASHDTPSGIFFPRDTRTWIENGIWLRLRKGEQPQDIKLEQVTLKFTEPEESPAIPLEDREWRTGEDNEVFLWLSLRGPLGHDRANAKYMQWPNRSLSVPRVSIQIEYTLKGENTRRTSLPIQVEVVSRRWPAAAAILVVFSFLLGAALLLKYRPTARRRGAVAAGQRPGLYDAFLGMITTPLGTYSLSMLQVLLWTCVTLFGYTFIWKSMEGSPDVPPQVLMLLGIGSGTALLSRLTAGSRHSLPQRYLRLCRSDTKPSFADLIAVDGQPSLFKFQMLAFTIIAVIIVILEIWENCRFAKISDTLVALMGLSSTAYIGNESVQAKAWNQVLLQIKRIEDLAKAAKVPITTEEDLWKLVRSSPTFDPAREQMCPALPAEVDVLRSLLQEIYMEVITPESLIAAPPLTAPIPVTLLVVPEPSAPPPPKP